MKDILKTAEAANFSAVCFGKMGEMKDYVLELGPDFKIPGKVFGGSALKTTGCEFSFQVFEPGQETGFLHTHKTHEELYFVLRGDGEFQVDGHVFKVSEGSVVRVSPKGKRSMRNNGREPMVVLCVQYLGSTFAPETATADADLLNEPIKW